MEIKAHITGNLWKVLVKAGDTVNAGDNLVIIESMKMEMPLESPVNGVVETIHAEEGQSVAEGQTLVTIK